jgi:oligopeptidase B
MKTPLSATGKSNWTDVVAHRDSVYLEGFEILKDYLVLEERSNGLNNIKITRWDGKETYQIPFAEETYMAYLGTNPEFDTQVLRFGYTSMTTPSSVIDLNLQTKVQTVLKEQEVVGGYDKSAYASERVWATAPDGTKVPISLVYRKDQRKETGNPLLLYGYGSYGATIDPGFSSTRLSLLDRGFIYAIAHVRGGQYLGRAWYEDGKLLKKMNTFTDFIACGEFLVQEGYTQTDKLFAMGGSAGGLLMGAVVNLRPDLWKGVVAQVPFVDVVTTMLDETIPLTTFEYDEWGNPNQLEYYNYMLSYSPYDQVKAQAYPAMLVTTGLHDSQVQYWEPAKWVAKLRAQRTDKSVPLLMYCNMETGHGGASGRFEAYRETAMEYAFMLDLLGINQ